MVDHGGRAHSVWSASATARNVHCAGALALTFDAPDNPSIHADTGTAVHQIAERCLRSDANTIDFLGTVEKTKKHDITITEDLCEAGQVYVDYCRELIGQGAQYWVEERFTLAELDPPFDAGGMGDFTAYLAKTKTLEIVDYKNGVGTVEAVKNMQERSYGLGALLKHPELAVEWVKTTIVQPRAFHRDGPVRSETIHVSELIEWTAELLDAMDRSKQAMDAFDAAGSNTVLLDEWTEAWLRPGKCTFCPVEGSCPALRKNVLAAAAVFFEPETDQPKIGNSALDTSPEALARDLNMIPMLEDWIKARRALAHTTAENGIDLPGYQLVDKIGTRKWADPIKTVQGLEAEGVVHAHLFEEPKLKSPAQMEKLLGAKRKALIEPFVTRETTGTNLVSISATSRPPAKSKAANFFETE